MPKDGKVTLFFFSPLSPPLAFVTDRRVSVAPFGADKGDADLLQNPIPCGGLRLQHHSNLSQWPNWIHALQ